jgi:sporulation protein YlmC with PRC-barrel domain
MGMILQENVCRINKPRSAVAMQNRLSSTIEDTRMTILSSSTICGDEVVNSAGERLGDIKELMIDCASSRVSYAVLEFGGFLGMGTKLFAVPMQAVKLDAENKRFVLDMKKERLENAPGFDKETWPDFADAAFADSIHNYYGIPRN